MSRGIPHTLAILCLVAILGSPVLHPVAGAACLRAWSTSDCQRDTTSESQAQAAPCSLFCCTGLPGPLKITIPPALSLAVALPGIHGLSARLAPLPPPPRFSLFIPARSVTIR